jgi:hypothetical protein
VGSHTRTLLGSGIAIRAFAIRAILSLAETHVAPPRHDFRSRLRCQQAFGEDAYFPGRAALKFGAARVADVWIISGESQGFGRAGQLCFVVAGVVVG